jgi:hypothetical protein
MDFWQRMQHALDQGVNSSRDLFDRARDKAKDLGEKGILKFELMQLENQAEKLVAQLGTRTYEILVLEGKDAVVEDDAGVRELIRQIGDVRRRIEEKEVALKMID